MKYNYAVDTITMGDVDQFFSGPKWPIKDTHGDQFVAESTWDIKVVLKKLSTNYFVEIYDLEDSSDSDELVTDDPIGAIKKFLSKGMPEGDKLLDSIASSPNKFAGFLKKLASSIDCSGNLSRVKVRRVLRRASIIPSCRFAGGKGAEKDIDALYSDLKGKGWKVEKEGDGALSELVVNIGGVYEAKISAESITWEYAFIINGTDDGKASGTTDDPLAEFKKWQKNPDTKSAYEAKKESDKARREEIADQETVAPGRGGVAPTQSIPAS